jgi:hypothetical protein
MSSCYAVKNSYNSMGQLGETILVYSCLQRLLVKII